MSGGDFFSNEKSLTLTRRRKPVPAEIGARPALTARETCEDGVSLTCRHCQSTPRICRPKRWDNFWPFIRIEETQKEGTLFSVAQ